VDPYRVTSLETGRYGMLGESGVWQEIIRAYYQDEMKVAWDSAQAMSAGNAGQALDWFRMIEGEGIAREQGTIREIGPNLRLESIDREVPDHETVGKVIDAACETVAKRLGWTFDVGVLATILPAEVDAPWHEARYGYAMDKYPYDKICLPQVATAHDEELTAVASHEFAHIITINYTGNRAPQWVEEGISTTMENRPLLAPSHWCDPDKIDASFTVDRRDPSTMTRVDDAYKQARLLVNYLYEQKGDEGLAAFLHGFTNNGLWTEIKINVFGEPSVHEALHEVYGLTEAQLFERAKSTTSSNAY